MNTAKYTCRACAGVNVHPRDDLFEMIQKAGWTLCGLCGAPGRFKPRDPDLHADYQIAPVLLSATDVVMAPMQVLLFLKTRLRQVENARLRIQRAQQGKNLPPGTVIQG